MANAMVMVEVNHPLQYRTDVTVDDPRQGEVRIRMASAGLCHSDQTVLEGNLPVITPIILGHEGAGFVDAIGGGVDGLAVGDRVLITSGYQCHSCFTCLRGQPWLCETAGAASSAGGMLDGSTRSMSGGLPLRQLAMSGTFAELLVVPAPKVFRVPDAMPLKTASLIGCGVLTGIGAALNTCEIRPGDSVAIIGCGGVGLNVVQGARIACAQMIIAIDTSSTKLERARTFGATHAIDASRQEVEATVSELTETRGVDAAFEVIGLKSTMEQALAITRRGGQMVLVGVPPRGELLNIQALPMLISQSKTIRGCWFGSSDVNRDVPRCFDLYESGELKLDELVSATIGLSEINDAFGAMPTSDFIRTVVDFSQSR